MKVISLCIGNSIINYLIEMSSTYDYLFLNNTKKTKSILLKM